MNRPSLQEYCKQVETRRDSKFAGMSQPEMAAYAMQLGYVRESVKISGVTEWTEAHTIGALFMSSALKQGFQILANAGMMNKQGLALIVEAIHENEIIAIQLGEAPKEPTT